MTFYLNIHNQYSYYTQVFIVAIFMSLSYFGIRPHILSWEYSHLFNFLDHFVYN